MIAAIIIWFFMLLLIYFYGSVLLAGLKRILHMDGSATPPVSLVLLSGFVIITVFAMVANLFIPLGSVYVAILAAGAVLIAFRRNDLMPVSIPEVRLLAGTAFLFLFLIVLENATHIPSNPDTGLYHAQTIRWFETYRIVPGLGNLQERFAFNSSWLVLNASFSMAFLGLRSFHLVNGAFFLSAMVFFADGLLELGKKKLSVAGFTKIVFLFLGIYLLVSDVSSAGNDMPVSLITWILLALWIETIESPLNSDLKTVVIFLLSLYIITIKISSLPMIFLGLTIMIEYLSQKQGRGVFILGVVCAVVLLPWVIRSVILSGYLIFPLSQIDIFAVDWKIPTDRVEEITQAILDVARLGGRNRVSSLGMPFTQWAQIWLSRETSNQLMTYLVVLVSPLILLAGRVILPSIVSRKYLLAYAIALGGSMMWFFTAPDIRFGYGFLIGTCVISLTPLFVWLISQIDRGLTFLPTLILLVFLVFNIYTLSQSVDPGMISERWLLPADYRSSNVRVCGELGDIVLYCRKENGQCQYDAFPCVPSLRPNVEMRGPSLQDGFRTVLPEHTAVHGMSNKDRRLTTGEMLVHEI